MAPIGGGQLEFHAIDVAREMIAEGTREQTARAAARPAPRPMLRWTGGASLASDRPEAFRPTSRAREEREARAAPHVILFGAGHVGLALARALAPLPLAITLVDDREAPPPPLPQEVGFERLDDPEPLVEKAPAGSAFVILTHSHALDYRLADAALRRGDAALCRHDRLRDEAGALRALVPGAGRREGDARSLHLPDRRRKLVRDKRPEVIAALATAEILAHLLAAQEAGGAAEEMKTTTAHVSGQRSSGAKLGRNIRAA